MNIQLRSVALLAALAAAGCSAVVDPEKSDPLETAEGFCNSIQDVLAQLPCGTAPAAAAQTFGFLRTGCDTLQAAVKEGRYAYDSGKGAACIAAVERLGCRGAMNPMAMGYFRWPRECRDALRGAVPVGGACTYQKSAPGNQQLGSDYALGECVEGADCYTDGAYCGGTCRLPAGQNESCMGDRPCQPGLICAANAGYVCRLGTTGSYCTYSPSDCAPGYYCSGTACQVAASAGQPCSPGNYCNSSAWCNTGAVPATCASKVGWGAACSNDGQCQSGLCAYGACRYFAGEGESCANTYCEWIEDAPLYCHPTSQTCQRSPDFPLPAGADCAGLYTERCADGLFCDSNGDLGPPNTCQPQRGPGGDCTMNLELCRPGTTCLYVMGSSPPVSTCWALPGVGATCDGYNMDGCQYGLFCKTSGMSTLGVCSTLPTDGQLCATSGYSSCAPGHYEVYPATGGCVCARYLRTGEVCTYDDECGYYAGTGRQCGPGGTCQVLNACEDPIGWYATGPMYY